MKLSIQESPPKTINEVCGKPPDAFKRFVNVTVCEMCKAEYDKSKDGGMRRGFNMCKTCIAKFAKMPAEEFNLFFKKEFDLGNK